MGQEKLNASAQLSIKHKVINNSKFDEIIDSFTHIKEVCYLLKSFPNA